MEEKIQLKVQEILEADLEEGEKIFVEEVEPGIYYGGIETNRRGPGAVIIGEDLTYLYGTSAIGYSQLLEEFKLGKRTLDNNLKLSNGKYAVNEETKKAYEEYMKEIDRYNEQVANGETPNVKLGDLLNKYRDTFYDEELENKVKKIDEDNEPYESETNKEELNLIGRKNTELSIDEIVRVKKYSQKLFEKVNNISEELSKKVQDFAKEHSYETAKYLCDWNGYKCFEPIFNEDQPSYIGAPLLILVDENDNIRMSTNEEAMQQIHDSEKLTKEDNGRDYKMSNNEVQKISDDN